MKKFLTILALGPWCVVGHAEFKDGNRLLMEMTGNNMQQMAAIGYVAGAADAYLNVTHCMPGTVTLGQVHDMTKQYLEANPSQRHYSADSLVNAVLTATWPCARKGRGA